MIKTTLIGHASMLIQSNKTTILTDPVWFDYLWEEVNVLCPSIKLDISKIPPIDVLNISHRHQDHFDVRTLAYLAKREGIFKPDAVILAPKDDILVEVLKMLDFKNIKIVQDFVDIKIGDVTITPTPSLNEGDYFPEHGLLVNDGEVTIWNQVDTVVNPEIISFINNLYGGIDFAHSRFLPLLEGNFNHHKSLNLPFDEYCSFLKVAGALMPKFVVPGSASFRYRDELSFLNHYSFPTTSEQFLSDLSIFCSDIKSSTFLSGDIAYISKDGVKIERQASDFVALKEDDSNKIVFKPVMEVKPIISIPTNSENIKKQNLTIEKFLKKQFIQQIVDCDKFDGWRYWQVMYQLEVFDSKGDSEIWSIDFKAEHLELKEGSYQKINLYEGISTSDLVGLIDGKTSWDYVGICGNYRTFNNIYRVGDGAFEVFPAERAFPLPLAQIFPSNYEMDRNKYMKDVLLWKNKNCD
jgi:hypothetical protein